MRRLLLAMSATLATMYSSALLVYGGLSLVTDIQPSSPDSPGLFMLSVLVVKIGIAIGFVLLFYLARGRGDLLSLIRGCNGTAVVSEPGDIPERWLTIRDSGRRRNERVVAAWFVDAGLPPRDD